MKSIKAILSILVASAMLFAMIPLGALAARGNKAALAYEPSEAIVTFHPWINEEDIALFEEAYDIVCEPAIDGSDTMLVSMPRGADARRFVASATNDPRIAKAQLNARYHLEAVPNDPNFTTQWALTKMQMPVAWDLEQGQAAVVVAIIDTGIELGHPDLAAQLVSGHDFVNNDGDPSDDNGHGTHVAGIVGATGNNGAGISGVAWQTRIMPVKALNHLGIGTDITVANAIIWSIDNGAKIINLSFGGTIYSPIMQEAINTAAARGAVVVSAAGNEAMRGNPRMYPAAYNNVIAVGATDENDSKASFSSYGDYVDISAPGVSILSTSPGGQYVWRSGTSMAAPHVSGVMALLWGRQPGISSQQLVDYCMNTVDDVGAPGRDDQFGQGRINGAKAISTIAVAGSSGQIYGRVLSETGQPIPGTAVRINSNVVPTNQTGEFRFAGVLPGKYTVYYDAPGHVSFAQDNININGGEVRLPIIRLVPNQGEIIGTVTNEAGQPISGAAVRINSSIVPTDTGGVYRFSGVARGSYSIYYDAQGYAGTMKDNIVVNSTRTVVAPTALRPPV